MSDRAKAPHRRRAGRRAFAAILAASLLWSSCVTSGYRAAPRDTPPPVLLERAFEAGPVAAQLVTLITYNGPGSWKRNALWDEYVVTLRNAGSEPVTIRGATLTAQDGTVHTPGLAPWPLEKLSRSLERKYREMGVAFVRYTTPGVLILGSGIAVISASGIFSATASVAALGTVIVLPAYYVSVLAINHRNKSAMTREFQRRRLPFPLALAPGESRTGSLFFPMVPSPRSLAVQWSAGPAEGEAVLPLDFLSDLHVAPPPEKISH